MAVTSLTASSSSNVWELHGRREMSSHEMKGWERGEWQLHFFLLFHKPVVSNEGWYNLTFNSRHAGFERRQEMELEVDKGLGMAFCVTFLFKCKLSPRTDQNSVGDFHIAFNYFVNTHTLQNIINIQFQRAEKNNNFMIHMIKWYLLMQLYTCIALWFCTSHIS